MSTLNPDMLALAREARGISQTELARRIQRTPGYVNKVERGFLEPTESQIGALSEALRYPVAFLISSERVQGYDSPCLYHRKRRTLPSRLLERTEARMHALRLHVRWLLQGLDIEPMLSFHSMDPDEFGGPAAVAQALRRAWGRPRGPIRSLTELVEAAGGVVVLDDFGSTKLDGLSCWEKDGPPLFYLNRGTPVEVLRFTTSHELGHLIMHLHPTPDPEGEADQFAAEFLMPAQEIRGQLQNLQFSKLGPLKEYWGISMRNLITRATKLGVITSSRSRSLYVQLSQKGYLGFNEPYPLQPETPSTIREALKIHFGTHGYTIKQVIEMTKMDDLDWTALFGEDAAAAGARPDLRPVPRRLRHA
jgi:Zn-dependent peptidase ImmA (M78 family)/transcriptional regulator with XRE-family HTH domain